MKKWVIILIIVVALLGTLAYIGKKQVDKAMKYCYNYNIKKSKIKTVNSKTIDIEFALDFKNNSDIEAQVDGYRFDVLLNDVKISEVKSNSPVNIKPNAFTTIVVPINVSISSLLSNKLINSDTVKNLLIDRSKIMIKIIGEVSGGALGLKIKAMPLELSYSLAEMMAPSTEPAVKCQ